MTRSAGLAHTACGVCDVVQAPTWSKNKIRLFPRFMSVSIFFSTCAPFNLKKANLCGY
jgi:hypothetical protein